MIVALAFAVAYLAGQGQRVQTLAQYVRSMNWDPAKRGPLMILEPDQVRAKEGAQSLAAFHRTRVSLGGVVAIVPDTMVLIDGNPQQSPNMYDGLPRRVKVLYLMTTLSGNQWKAITGSGIGIGDLNDDQKAVFNSLLPRPFKYQTYAVGAKGDAEEVDKEMELGDSDLKSVRLQVRRGLYLMMPLANSPNGGKTPRETAGDIGKPGDTFIARDDDDEYRPETSFSVKIKQTAPNSLKTSDLKYDSKALSATISLNSSEKISELLNRIGRAAGLELYADLRVGDRTMVSTGGLAPIGSLLKAVALAVTGTYRKVGSAYILTSDLIGMGTRKMRLAARDEILNRKVWNQETEWRRQLGQSGHLKEIAFRDGDPLTPGDSLAQKLDLDPYRPDAKITSADLSENLKAFVQRQNKAYSTQSVTADGATAESEFRFSFVLPNGEVAKPENEALGTQRDFTHPGAESGTSQEQDQPKWQVPSFKDPLSICLSVDSPETALGAVQLATRYGFHELWVETWSKEALKAALAAAPTGLRVSWAVSPFDYRDASDALFADRTLFGDMASESMQRRVALTSETQPVASALWNPESRGCISPLSKGWEARQSQIIELSKTPGLIGIRIINSTPNGYAGPRVSYLSTPMTTPIFLEMGIFGFAEDLRLAFIRERSIDPIDTCPKSVSTNSDLRQPFFLDDALRGSSSIFDGTDEPDPGMANILSEYEAWLDKLNRKSVQSLLDQIGEANPAMTIDVDSVPPGINSGNRFGGELLPWKLGDPLPRLKSGGTGRKEVQRFAITADDAPLVLRILGYAAAAKTRSTDLAGICIDLSLLSSKEAGKFMSGSFVPVTK